MPRTSRKKLDQKILRDGLRKTMKARLAHDCANQIIEQLGDKAFGAAVYNAAVGKKSRSYSERLRRSLIIRFVLCVALAAFMAFTG